MLENQIVVDFVNGVGSNANDIRFLPLLFVVLAIAVRLSPGDTGADAQEERRIRSMRFYWSCESWSFMR